MSIFKAYDIRGVYPQELNEEIIYKIARAFAAFTNAKRIVVGGDNRLSTPSLKNSFIKGLLDSGVHVVDIGIVPTSMVYFACYKLKFEAGAMITASHNPKEFNGVKLCDSEGISIGLEDGLDEIKKIAEKCEFKDGKGKLDIMDIFNEYNNFVSKLLVKRLNGIKIVVDGSNGSAGIHYARILKSLGAEVAEIFCDPDGNFPNHETPDPLIDENLNEIKAEVKKLNADIGLAFDGDGDRMVVINDKGERSPVNHITALLAERCLSQNKNAKIVYDILSSQMVEEVVRQNGGIPIVWKAGHTFISRKCKEVDALFAGEVSSHYFFKEANYTDDTITAAIKILDIITSEKKKLSELTQKYPTYYNVLEKRIPIATEMKFKFIENLKGKLSKEGYEISTLDGAKVKFQNGWAAFRASNTESKIVISYESPDYDEFKKIESFVDYIIKTISNEAPDVKLIIFDLEKVLIPTWRNVFDLPELGIRKSSISEFFDDQNSLRKELQYGRVSEEEFWKQFIASTSLNVTVEQMKIAVRKVLKPYLQVLDLVKSLKKNYKLCILSNFTKEWAEYLIDQYKLTEIFNEMFWSFQKGIKKPLPESYLQITEKFKMRPEECLFIDDKERNINGARSIGMKTILYTNLENLKKKLSENGVKVGG
ncbi:MAG: HAD-IA family hydrolase [Candidatus Aenigmarchaeota archaeon]|nr:HAD-IA family hydrolase [Candidatus Aenigmarchaeota archaeon]